ncbi:biotin transporter BioY [Corynebacterium sp. LK2510]|uniref:biotin transporter BioY n=1 Tax=Corynebacterium sp. LK2510 TaxID=3110472 RepID=UPI0034CE2327
MTTRTRTRSNSSAMSDLAYIAVFTALVIVLGFVAIPVGALGVPIVLQNAIIVLAGLVLGARRGFLVAALFITIGLFLPVLAGGRTTLQSLSSPTAGYLLAYLVSAPVAGAIARWVIGKSKGAQFGLFALAGFIGILVQYIGGAIGMMVRADLGLVAAIQAQLPFVPTGLVKLAVIVIVAVGVHAAFPKLLRGESAR